MITLGGFMNKMILIALLFLSSCGVFKGDKGDSGSNGSDNHFIKAVNCIGTLSSGPWNGVSIDYSIYLSTYGDVFVQASLAGMGNFNNSATAFYSVTQVGASTGAVYVSIDNSNYAEFTYKSSLNNIVVVFHSTNGNGYTYLNSNACTLKSF
jgi:hypothetical protein